MIRVLGANFLTMKLFFTILLLTSCLMAKAQTPATTAPAKELTPAEIRQKERVAKAIEEERKYREEIAKAQREYQAKQAEKERKRLEKEVKKKEKDAAPAPKSSQPAAPESMPVSQPEKPAEVTNPVKEKVAPKAEEKATVPKPEKAPRQPKVDKKAVAPKPAKAPRPPKPPKESPSPTVQPEPTPVAEPTSGRNQPERAPETKAPDLKKAERDAIRQQQQAERLRIQQQEQADRDARKAQRARAKTNYGNAETATNLIPEAARVPGKEFLPKGHLFAPILLDPLEAQTYVSVLPAFRTDNTNYPGTIVPFAFGLCKPFYRWTKFPGRASELSLDVASFTQFEVYYDDAKQTQKRQLINTDYKFSVIYNLLRNSHVWRFRFYHLSSHLGDDYLFRNSIQAYTPNSVNYEIVDATYSKNIANTRVYGGIGIGLRKTEERKLLSAHTGFYYRNLQSTRLTRMVGGVDVKVWQQTNFRPGIKAAIGLEVGKAANPVTFMLEAYSGFRPYSQYENQYVRWVGIGFYFNPI